jgi:tetratricopeptide (TPR) repeat protein
LRDEAAKHAKNQLEWVRAYCREHPDDPLAHLYYARLLDQKEKTQQAAEEFERAADLLGALADRTEQQTNGLLEALDDAAAFHAGKKAWRTAIPLCERIVQATESADWPRARNFRAFALYNLAIAHAQIRRADQALEYLRQAIEIDSERKAQSREDELLAPLRGDKRFRKLTGS